ncbi:MAG TPA: YXWGXW repeat-containing protein, partial [Terriglobales bacterium]|nr:YXWGXW repeat-containing protein [Terriglobales bacterium]
MTATAFAQFNLVVTVGTPPPVLVVYEQPPCPGYGFLWAPGYWAYGPYGYYWVPGTWVEAPAPGLLWTPGYWAFDDDGDAFVWHPGYWGYEVGYYGGIDYGFGYFGSGYQGGYWRGERFYYNAVVNNVSVNNVRYVYSQTVVQNITVVNNVSYNGGAGGTTTRPTQAELRVAQEQHVQPTATQVQHQRAASSDRVLLASVNHGQPPVAATAKPATFSGAGVVAAKPVTARTGAHGNGAEGGPAIARPPSATTPSTA